jgi:uncharacterized protein YjiS (DUF1127 family)
MRLLPRLCAALVSLALWPLRVAAARATLRQLAAFDARLLADIGLTPADLNDATALPLASEPGLFLAARVDGRRVAHLALGGPSADETQVGFEDRRPNRLKLVGTGWRASRAAGWLIPRMSRRS